MSIAAAYSIIAFMVALALIAMFGNISQESE